MRFLHDIRIFELFALTDDRGRARSELCTAAGLAERGDMRMFAAAAHHRICSLPGATGDDRRRGGQADAAMRREHIRNPTRMLVVLAPGLP